MRLEIFLNNGKDYIRIVNNVSVKNPETGIRVSRKITVKNIGPVSRFDDGKPDFIQRLKASYDACDPIIEELRDYLPKSIKKETYNIKLFEGSPDCFADPKLISSVLFEKILEELDISQLIRSYKTKYAVGYDVYGFFKDLVFGRILNPASKFTTVSQNGDYYDPLIKGDFYEYNVYDTLDFINEHQKAIFNRINSSMVKKYGRTANYIYYDVTNFFFEIDENDEDICLDNGESIPGLRKNGVSKEERKQPIVQMGLLMDEQGIPISIEVFPGNTLDHQTLQSSLSGTVDSVTNSRYVYVCDKGVGRGDNIGYAVAGGNGYLTSKSVRGSTNEEKKWILDKNDYITVNDSFKYKTRVTVRKMTTPDGHTVESSEKELTYWSRNFYEREKHEKKDFFELLEKIATSPESFRISKTQCGLLKKYYKKDVTNVLTGEIIDSTKLKVNLNMDKLARDYELMGFYTLVTSEVNMPDTEMIEIYKNLVEIEDQFRIMKSTLDTRPIFVRKREHITAHLTICAIALIILRLIQRQIKLKHSELLETVRFSTGLSADRIQAALNKWKVEKLGDVYYRFAGLGDKDLVTILNSFGIKIAPKCYKIGELKHLKSQTTLSPEYIK